MNRNLPIEFQRQGVMAQRSGAATKRPGRVNRRDAKNAEKPSLLPFSAFFASLRFTGFPENLCRTRRSCQIALQRSQGEQGFGTSGCRPLTGDCNFSRSASPSYSRARSAGLRPGAFVSRPAANSRRAGGRRSNNFRMHRLSSAPQFASWRLGALALRRPDRPNCHG